MKRWMLALTLALWAQSVQAQLRTPIRPLPPTRPTVSPFINLGRGGPAGINYYSLVRPQMDTFRGLQALGQEVQQLAPAGIPGATGTGATGIITTGIQGTGTPNYMFYSHYFPTMPATGISPFGARR